MIDDNDEDRPFCPSCHKAYSDHDGLIRTCRDLQRAKSNIDLLRKSLADMIDAADESRPCTIYAIEAIRKTKP